MKYSILFIAFLLPYLVYSQTYIGGSLSKEFSTIEQVLIAPEDVFVFDLRTELYESSGKRQIPLILGVRLDHYFSNRIAFSWSGEYYTTKVSGYNFETGLHIQHGYKTQVQHFFRHKVNLRIYPFKRWSIGLGVNYANPIGGHWETYDDDTFSFHTSSSGTKAGIKGWHILSGYAYKNFLFIASYGNSRTFTTSAPGISFSLSQMETLNFTLSYRFQILKKPLRLGRKNKVKCAEF